MPALLPRILEGLLGQILQSKLKVCTSSCYRAESCNQDCNHHQPGCSGLPSSHPAWLTQPAALRPSCLRTSWPVRPHPVDPASPSKLGCLNPVQAGTTMPGRPCQLSLLLRPSPCSPPSPLLESSPQPGVEDSLTNLQRVKTSFSLCCKLCFDFMQL